MIGRLDMNVVSDAVEGDETHILETRGQRACRGEGNRSVRAAMNLKYRPTDFFVGPCDQAQSIDGVLAPGAPTPKSAKAMSPGSTGSMWA